MSFGRQVFDALFLVTVLMVLALGAGCSRQVTPEPTPQPDSASPSSQTETPAAAPTPAATSKIAVYFVRGEEVVAVTRTIEATTAIATAALTELLGGPTSEERTADLFTEIPEGTRLLGLTIEGTLATVDLSSEFESGGGTLSMTLRLDQILDTLFAFPTIESIAFRIDGAPVEAIGGEGLMVSPPITRSDRQN